MQKLFYLEIGKYYITYLEIPMKILLKLILPLVFLSWSVPAFAFFYGSPVRTVEDGKMAGGFYYGQTARVITVDSKYFNATTVFIYTEKMLFGNYGIGKAGMVQLIYGQTDITYTGASSAAGTQYGANYRHQLDVPLELGGREVLHGGFASYRTGSYSQTMYKGSYNAIEFGYGGDMEVADKVVVYAAGLYSQLTGTIESTYTTTAWSGATLTTTTKTETTKFKSTNNIGVYGGGVYKLDKNISFGGEYHLIFEAGYALFFQYNL